ncbi:MAG: FecR family protein [Flavobacterium sp.]|nr:FecR family protein [Flavobacterium sp.]
MLTKWLNNELTEEEIRDFKQNPDYSLYKSIIDHSSNLKTIDFNEEDLYRRIKIEKNKSTEVIALARNWFFRIAAVVLITIGLFVFYQQQITTVEYAEKGLKNSFSLPDSSEITLNSDSKVSYKKEHWENNRNLHLEGEAYFKVAKGQTFQVTTDLGKVAVLGTQFNVKARKSRFEVICFEGKVEVLFKDETVTLTRGQKVIFDNNRLLIQNNTVALLPSWLDNEISFEQERLKNILDEIERQYNVKISAKNNISNQLFTGKLPSNNLDVALQIISSTYHLQTKKVSNFQYELKKK